MSQISDSKRLIRCIPAAWRRNN